MEHWLIIMTESFQSFCAITEKDLLQIDSRFKLLDRTKR